MHAVILDDHHLRDLLTEHLNPPPSLIAQQASLIRMGFPSHAGREDGDGALGMCLCHMDTGGEKITSSGYICPQCQARYKFNYILGVHHFKHSPPPLGYPLSLCNFSTKSVIT